MRHIFPDTTDFLFNPMNLPLAFNIAFIPEDATVERCQQISQELVNQGSSNYLLGRDGAPHITLLQGIVESPQSFEGLSDAVERARDRPPYPTLHSEGYYQMGEKASLWWKVERSSELQAWHDRVFALAHPFIGNSKAQAEMFGNSGHVREQDLQWVEQFGEVAVQDNFLPHITLGYGQAPDIPLEETFQIGYLGLFQLGPFCSCYNRLV